VAPRFDLAAKRFLYWQKKNKALARTQARKGRPEGAVWIAGRSRRK
jgi:hypothetical protein